MIWLLYFGPMILLWVFLYLENDPIVMLPYIIISLVPFMNGAIAVLLAFAYMVGAFQNFLAWWRRKINWSRKRVR